MMLKKIISVCAVAILVGCTTPRTPKKIDHNIYKSNPTIVIAQLEPTPKAGYVKLGDQKLLDSLINHCVAGDVHDELERITLRSSLDKMFFDNFQKSFKEKNVKVIVDKNPLHLKSFMPTDKEQLHLAPYEFKRLKESYKADYALILQIFSFGVVREYYGFIPAEAPNAYIEFEMYLVNLDNNLLVGYSRQTIENRKSADGWVGHDAREIGDLVIKHVENSLENSRQYLVNF
jgi:hypothetical protein